MSNFDTSFMNEPRPNSPIGAGDDAIRRLKSRITNVFGREMLGFDDPAASGLDATQGYLREGAGRIFVSSSAPTTTASGRTLGVNDLGRLWLRLPAADAPMKMFVWTQVDTDYFWAPVPEGVPNEVRWVSGGFAEPSNFANKQLLLTEGTMPGWFVADGRLINLPAEFGGNVQLPDLIDAYVKGGALAASAQAGSHTRTAAELVNHTHNVPGQTITTSTQSQTDFEIGWQNGGGNLIGDSRRYLEKESDDGFGRYSISVPHTHTAKVAAIESSANAGSSETMNIEPKRFVLVPIVRVY